jgi:hypothetical protein
VWTRLGRFEECCRRIASALAVVEPGGTEELALQIALGYGLLSSMRDPSEVEAVNERAVALAAMHQDVKSQLRSAFVRWDVLISRARIHLALEASRRFRELAVLDGGHFEELIADRMEGVSELLGGNFRAARAAIERVRARSPNWDPREPLRWYAYDPDTMARNTLVTLLWLDGRPDSAAAVARDNATRALAAGNHDTAAVVLADACCGLAILVDDQEAAEEYLALLKVSLANGGAPGYGVMAQIFRAVLSARHGDPGPGVRLVDAGLPPITDHPRFASPMAELANTLGSAGAVAHARRLADHLFERVSTTGEWWILSEIQRIRGDLSEDGDRARELLQSALDTARAQEAKAWGLRAATSYARRWPEAAGVLAPWVETFTEGFRTRDLIEARSVLHAAGR